MEKQNKQITKLKLYILILGFAFFVQTIFLIFYCKQLNFLSTSNFGNINSIFEEIGKLKSENQKINEKFFKWEREENKNREILLNLNKFLLSVEEKKEEGKTTENSLKQQNLINALNPNKNKSFFNTNSQKINTNKFKTNANKKVIDKIKVFLLLGRNGGLTDSIQLIFVNLSTKKITLLSIPRDLFYEGRKINEFLKKYGVEKLKQILEEITGFEINHYISIDFKIFTDFIDSLDGINIMIDKKIVDKHYPDINFRYKTVIFEPGIEKMNGERALEFARSRKSTSDFDRSLRQQKILLAIREKLKTKPVFENINFYMTIFNNIKSSLNTDLDVFSLLQYYDQFKEFDLTAGNILSNENFLYSSVSSTGQSILLPKNNDYTKFKTKLLDIITMR